jgi:hypothetical protein
MEIFMKEIIRMVEEKVMLMGIFVKEILFKPFVSLLLFPSAPQSPSLSSSSG